MDKQNILRRRKQNWMKFEKLCLIFHKNHVIYEILWSSHPLEGPEITHIIKNLKLWHVYRYNITLDAQLYDMVDVEAWFERL